LKRTNLSVFFILCQRALIVLVFSFLARAFHSNHKRFIPCIKGCIACLRGVLATYVPSRIDQKHAKNAFFLIIFLIIRLIKCLFLRKFLTCLSCLPNRKTILGEGFSLGRDTKVLSLSHIWVFCIQNR
jgi:hypothetical protein